MAHSCHATECQTPIPREYLMCLRHWRMVPAVVRAYVRHTYRPGQCDDMNPSVPYCRAAKNAVIAVARQEGKTPDTRLYDLFLARHPETRTVA